MRALRHILVTCAGVFLLIGLPFLRSDYFAALRSGEDAVTSASVQVDEPSGEFIVMINRGVHPNEENLALWEEFFSGGEIGFIFEDLTCAVSTGDSAGKQLAESFQSRLPENQMKIAAEDPVLMLSKADNGRFDIIIMSAEAAESFKAETVSEKNDTVVIRVTGGDQ